MEVTDVEDLNIFSTEIPAHSLSLSPFKGTLFFFFLNHCTPFCRCGSAAELDNSIVDKPVVDLNRIRNVGRDVTAQESSVAQDHVILRNVRRIRLQNHFFFPHKFI